MSEQVNDLPVESSSHRPDDLHTFRVARLAVLLDVLDSATVRKPVDIERLGFYDFFSANPFLVLGDDDPARRAIALAGFSSFDLSYQSSGHRFANRRARLRNDVALLISYGLAQVAAEGQRVVYSITEQGRGIASALQSLYAQAYRASAREIIARLDRLSDSALRHAAKEWLNDDRVLIDLYDEGEPRESGESRSPQSGRVV